MILFVIFVALVVALGLAAARWGVDSRHGIDSEDGQQRTRATLTFPSHHA
jgi:hypothetical protein